MSGLVKAKKYDWKDSNLALFGSDTEKNVKKAAAETEKAWIGVGKEPGLRIWRIEQFKVRDVPKESYGTFYDGDSYIILNTYKNPENPASEELLYDVHFWIGKYSTADEYGTAAYKTVELDTYLDDKPVQHREVYKHESDLFKSYFKTFKLLKGGVASGFKKVVHIDLKKQLFVVTADKSGNKHKIKEQQKALKQENMDSTGTCILDYGDKLYVVHGCDCPNWLRMDALSCANEKKEERNGRADIEVLEGEDAQCLIDTLPSGTKKEKPEPEDFKNCLVRVTLKDCFIMDFKEIREALPDFTLNSHDVYIGDNGKHCFVWVGLEVSIDGKRNSMTYGHKYLMGTDHQLIPISTMVEGKESSDFSVFITNLGAKLPPCKH